MALVSYYVDDVLGEILDTLQLTGYYEMLGGHYAFASDSIYSAAIGAAYDEIWRLLDDDNPDNDHEGYLDILETTESIVMRWSTEKGIWV